jgi:hypothetical protein
LVLGSLTNASLFFVRIVVVSFAIGVSSAGFADPGSLAPVVDATESSGLTFSHRVDDSQNGGEPWSVYVMDGTSQRTVNGGFGVGIAAGDFNNDGWVDLFIPNGFQLDSALMRNNGDGTFTNVTTGDSGRFPVAVRYGQPVAALFLDLDNDGDQDLYVGCDDNLFAMQGEPNLIFENRLVPDGEAAFVRRSVPAVELHWWATAGPAAADYDLDGDLDLYLSYFTRVPRDDGGVDFDPPLRGFLLRNELHPSAGAEGGPFRFTRVLSEPAEDGFVPDISMAVGLDVPPFRRAQTPWQAIWSDINRDGWPDLHVAVDFDPDYTFLNNKDGTFTDVAEDVGHNAHGDASDMGVTLGDYDNDGDLDMFSTLTGEGVLYRNDFVHDGVTLSPGEIPEYTWVPEQVQLPGDPDPSRITNVRWGWGCAWMDYDLDGWLDLAVGNGQPPWPWPGERDRCTLLLNNTDGTFSDVSEEIGYTREEIERGLVAFDYDRDGDLDIALYGPQADQSALYIFEPELEDGTFALYRNDTINEEGQSVEGHGYFVVEPKLIARGGAAVPAIGAEVTLKLRSGLTQRRLITAGNSFLSQEPPLAHFGLGNASAADIEYIEVVWPGPKLHRVSDPAVDYQARTTRHHGPFSGLDHHQLTLMRTSVRGDADSDGDVDLADFSAFQRCVGPDGVPKSAACSDVLDIDYDGDVDLADFARFQHSFTGSL